MKRSQTYLFLVIAFALLFAFQIGLEPVSAQGFSLPSSNNNNNNSSGSGRPPNLPSPPNLKLPSNPSGLIPFGGAIIKLDQCTPSVFSGGVAGVIFKLGPPKPGVYVWEVNVLAALKLQKELGKPLKEANASDVMRIGVDKFLSIGKGQTYLFGPPRRIGQYVIGLAGTPVKCWATDGVAYLAPKVELIGSSL